MPGRIIAANTLVPFVIENKKDSIINRSPSTVSTGFLLFLHYVFSKTAVAGITRVMARERGEQNIRVNAVKPRITEIKKENVRRADELFARIVDIQAIKRVERPEDF